MTQSLKVLKRRTREYGMSIRKNRGGGYSLIIDGSDAVWSGCSDYLNLDLEDIEYWLDEFDKNQEG